MAQDLSYEDPDGIWFITTRTIASKLWFINNPLLERSILAFLAKYVETHEAIIYGFILMGNHYHLIARFPRANKAAFLRSFNSIIARLVSTHVANFDGGKLWGRRARVQKLPENDDVRHWTIYAALNPVFSGLTAKYSEYPCYNSISDALTGKARKFKLVDWRDFNNRKRRNKHLTKEECTKTYTLRYERLPGYEQLSQKDYREELLDLIELRRKSAIAERREQGRGFAGREILLATKPGTRPRSTKKSERHSKRPLILTLSWEARKIALDAYFALLSAYRAASRRFRSGCLDTSFPPGTYRPTLLCAP